MCFKEIAVFCLNIYSKFLNFGFSKSLLFQKSSVLKSSYILRRSQNFAMFPLSTVITDKSKVEMSQNFVAFSEYMYELLSAFRSFFGKSYGSTILFWDLLILLACSSNIAFLVFCIFGYDWKISEHLFFENHEKKPPNFLHINFFLAGLGNFKPLVSLHHTQLIFKCLVFCLFS